MTYVYFYESIFQEKSIHIFFKSVMLLSGRLSEHLYSDTAFWGCTAIRAQHQYPYSLFSSPTHLQNIPHSRPSWLLSLRSLLTTIATTATSARRRRVHAHQPCLCSPHSASPTATIPYHTPSWGRAVWASLAMPPSTSRLHDHGVYRATTTPAPPGGGRRRFRSSSRR